MTIITESRAIARPLRPNDLFTSITGRIGAFYRRGRAARDLASMNDYLLQDIGLSRTDAAVASFGEFGASGAGMLERRR